MKIDKKSIKFFYQILSKKYIEKTKSDKIKKSVDKLKNRCYIVLCIIVVALATTSFDWVFGNPLF